MMEMYVSTKTCCLYLSCIFSHGRCGSVTIGIGIRSQYIVQHINNMGKKRRYDKARHDRYKDKQQKQEQNRQRPKAQVEIDKLKKEKSKQGSRKWREENEGREKEIHLRKVRYRKRKSKSQEKQPNVAGTNFQDCLTIFRKNSQAMCEYPCNICHRLLWKNGVTEIKDVPQANTDLWETCLTDVWHKKKRWICHTCKKHLNKGKMPLQAIANNLSIFPTPKCEVLNDLEAHLIAPCIPFAKIVALPKGKQRGIHGPVVCVPANIVESVNVLPRPVDDSTLLKVKLKRKLGYLGHHLYRTVSPRKIQQWLHFLKDINPSYKDMTIDMSKLVPLSESADTLIYSCDKEESHKAHTFSHTESPECPSESEQSDNEEDFEDATKQRNVNQTTAPLYSCLQPLDISQHISDAIADNVICLAPAEGGKPTSAYNKEAESFPTKFPDGCNTFIEKRDKKIGLGRYLNQRLFNLNNTFSSDATYIFWGQFVKEITELTSCIAIALRQGSNTDMTAEMLLDDVQVKKMLRKDQGYKYMKTVRGTPAYWEKTLSDLFAMIRQLGLPTFFTTFSAADRRWTEICQCICNQLGEEYNENMDWSEYCQLINKNPVTAARMFDHRAKCFLRDVIFSKSKPIGEVRDYFHRVEFQQRGWPHLHCLIWIEDAPIFNREADEVVCSFIDKYISCALPDSVDDEELFEKVTNLQSHSKGHTVSCRKKPRKGCRYNFPRPPSTRTFIVRKTDNHSMDLESAKNCLKNLHDVLSSTDESITSEALFKSAGETQESFENAMCTLSKKNSICMKREPKESWINGYNPQLLRAWDANMDIQFVLDPYSCIMYIVSYISKAERELGTLIKQAQHEAREKDNMEGVEELRRLGNVYMTHREVSVMEAVYRVTGLQMKHCTRDVVFIPTDINSTRLSLPLEMLKQCDSQSKEVWMKNITDRYYARPDEHPFPDMCLAEFAARYKYIGNSKHGNGKKEEDNEEDVLNIVEPSEKSSSVVALKNNNGYLQERKTRWAVIRYPKFSVDKDPERYYYNDTKLYLPHRSDLSLPATSPSYEEYYHNGNYTCVYANTLRVQDLIEENKMKFTKVYDGDIEAAKEDMENVDTEEAWTTFASLANKERDENQNVTDTADDIPELKGTEAHKKASSSKTMSVLPTTPSLSAEEGATLLRNLNNKQQQVFNAVTKWCWEEATGKKHEPLRLFVTGGAGTGKSQLIKAIKYHVEKVFSYGEEDPDKQHVLLTAPTGTAAFNIGGLTLHNAFRLPCNQYNYIPLQERVASTLRATMGSLKLLIIDEISMVGKKMLSAVSERLNQIMRPGVKQPSFGNISVLTVGDFCQLPPVRGASLLSIDHGSLEPQLWETFSVVELTEIMRQKEDKKFALLLNRLRMKVKDDKLPDEDKEMLLGISKNGAHDTDNMQIHLFGTNAEVNEHNNSIMATFTETRTLAAVDTTLTIGGKFTVEKKQLSYGPHNACMLPDTVTIAKGCRVMVTANVNVSDGIVNGAMGSVTNIFEGDEPYGLPQYIGVAFDNDQVGKMRKGNQPQLPGLQECVLLETHTSQRIQIGSKVHVRHQYPLKLAWASTVHKVQGSTLQNLVVCMNKINRPGQAYVALSRCTSLHGLSLKDFKEDNIFVSEQIRSNIDKMPVLPKSILLPLSATKKEDHNHFTTVHINVQSLVNHYDDLRKQIDIQEAEVIAVTETWLNRNYCDDQVNIPGNIIFRADRKSGRGGGILLYCKDSVKSQLISAGEDDNQNQWICIHIIQYNYFVCAVYRKPNSPASALPAMVQQYKEYADKRNCHLIVLGDFNENLLDTHSHPIHSGLSSIGAKQNICEPTTNGGTLIDHIYTFSHFPTICGVLPTYYSYHRAVFVTICHAMPAVDSPHSQCVHLEELKAGKVKPERKATNPMGPMESLQHSNKKTSTKKKGNKKRKHPSCKKRDRTSTRRGTLSATYKYGNGEHEKIASSTAPNKRVKLEPPSSNGTFMQLLKSHKQAQVCESNAHLAIHGEHILQDDLLTLQHPNWINDKIINTYLQILQRGQNSNDNRHIFAISSFMAVLWTERNFEQWLFRKVPLHQYEWIFLPVHINGNHWVLLAANVPKRTVLVLDSLDHDNDDLAQKWITYMRHRTLATNTIHGTWTTTTEVRSGRQEDGSSCGAFVMLNALALTNGMDPELLTNNHALLMRRHIKSEIIKNSENIIQCHFMGCTNTDMQPVICCAVCTRWFHVECVNENRMDYVCLICTAQYN